MSTATAIILIFSWSTGYVAVPGGPVERDAPTNPVLPARKAAWDGELHGPVPLNYANLAGSGGTKRFNLANFYILLTFAGRGTGTRRSGRRVCGRLAPGSGDSGGWRASVRPSTVHESVESRRVTLVEALTQAGELGTGGTVDENEIEDIARR